MTRTAIAIRGAVLATMLYTWGVADVRQPRSRPVHPLALDRTGIKWVMPFAQARVEARRRNRLLLVKPVAFGTDRRGGW